jgi:hypothetical protein
LSTALVRAAVALLLAAKLGSCVGPPPSHALVVRNLQSKCALVAFSGCGAFHPPDEAGAEHARTEDEDAGVE